MKEERIIKGINSQIKVMEVDSEVMKVEVTDKQRQHNTLMNRIKNLKERIDKLDEDTSIRVSEHAIVRYFERVKGFNIIDIEKEILTDEVLDLVDKLGVTGGYPNKDFKVLIKNFTVTTVV